MIQFRALPLAVHLIFRFFTGFAGSAFMSVAGGSIADLFHKDEVSTSVSAPHFQFTRSNILNRPVAIYTASPFIGPVLGPLISGSVNLQSGPHLNL